MPAPSLDLALDYHPRLPRRKDWAIGCLGAGFIMRDCHLVAYQQAGFNPIAIVALICGVVTALVGRFVPRTEPNAPELEAAIEAELSK